MDFIYRCECVAESSRRKNVERRQKLAGSAPTYSRQKAPKWLSRQPKVGRVFWCGRWQDRSPRSRPKVPSKFPSKSARNRVLMIWSAILTGRDREISEWNPIEWPHFREVAEMEQQIACLSLRCHPAIPELAQVPAEPCKIMFFLGRLDRDRTPIQSSAKLPGTHYRTVIYALNVNRTRNWSKISIKLWIRFFGYPN